jgi:hypothetical protein
MQETRRLEEVNDWTGNVDYCDLLGNSFLFLFV